MSLRSEVVVMGYMDDNAISLRWVIDFIYLIMTWMTEDEWRLKTRLCEVIELVD